jgi:DNA-binding response OmpR family regulator
MELILIADDELDVCMTLSEQLEDVGYETSYVQDGQAALDYLENNKVDALILDLNMPVKDGWEVLRELSLKKNKTRVIVVTAYSDLKSAIEATKLGALDFISKPYDFDEVLISLRKVLTKS